MSGQILEEQKSKSWPGLAVEAREICEELNIPDINLNDVPDGQIKKAVFSNHYSKMKDDIENSRQIYFKFYWLQSIWDIWSLY